jgi:hypothetical protein
MKADHIVEALTGDSGWKHMIPQVDSSDFPTQWVPSAYECSIIDAQAKEIEKLRAQLRHLEELAEADKAGRLVVLPFTSGRTLLCKENIDSPRLMKDVELAIRYCSSCGIVFHMDYNVFCDLVKQGRITAVSEETEKVLGAMKDE